MAETTHSDSLSRGMRPDSAKRLIASFAKRFKQPHLYFAQHAAFPMALTPDLLYRLWINFRHNIKGEMLDIPWIAVADLLLSPLCNEVGHELYEMDVTVRTELLKALKDNADFDQQRISELSDFLLEYIRQQLNSDEPDIKDIAQAQQWTTLAFAQPSKAAGELATALRKAVEQNDKIEQVRIVSLMETLRRLAEPLAGLEGFVPLLTYARGVGHLAYGDVESANAQFNAVQSPEKLEQALGIHLPIVEQVRREYETTRQQAQEIRKEFFISYHSADRDWAEWIAWQLEEAGYSIILQAWNFQVGTDFSQTLDTITTIANHVLFVLSPDFLKAFAAMPDWASAFDEDPRSIAEEQILMAVQVREGISEVEALVGEIVYTDLVGLDEKEAYARIGEDIISKMPTSTPENKQRVIFERPPFPGNPLSKTTKAIEVFIAYSHIDEALQRELVYHLRPLEKQGLITVWSDQHIQAGMEWESEINRHLKTARVILLLISPDFLASRYAYSIETKRAMERREAGEAVVIPIIIRPVDLDGTPFAKIVPLPKNGKPVTMWTRSEEAFQSIAEGVHEVVEYLIGEPLSNLLFSDTTANGTERTLIRNLPPRNPFFTDSEQVLEVIHNALTRAKSAAPAQPLAISGLGGVGKTQTALEYAYRYADDYRYIFWIRAETHEEAVAGLVAVALHLNLPQKDAHDQNITLNAVKHWFEMHTDWLLIFDNADDLAIVRDFFPSGSRGHILLTTRAYSTRGIARKVEIKPMKLEEGVSLLLRRAGIIAEDAAAIDIFPEPERTAAVELVHEMDGLPLALDQAGAYIEETGCSISRYLALYRQQHTALLSRRGGLSSDHPTSVVATWSLSFAKIEQTNPAAADLLRLCAFLVPNSIPEELFTVGADELGPRLQPVAAKQLALNDAISELLKYSLVNRDATTQTLSIHPLVQSVLNDQMNERTKRLWAERARKAIKRAFPDGSFDNILLSRDEDRNR